MTSSSISCSDRQIDVSVIIVNYNTLELTRDCIDSVFEKTKGVNIEIILVDNASHDGSRAYFVQDKRITYIYSEKNGGFGYGNNLGMKVAKGKYFFLLNSDTLLINNAIYEFFKFAENHDPKTVYGSWLVGDDGSYRTSFFFFPSFTIGHFLKIKIHPRDYSPTWDNRDVECVTGADMFFLREAYEQCGGFDENIFMYGEEGELQYRMKRNGYRRMLINTPRIIHLEGKSSVPSKRSNNMRLKGHLYVLRKWMDPFTYIVARFFYFIVGIASRLNLI